VAKLTQFCRLRDEFGRGEGGLQKDQIMGGEEIGVQG
jgi:hypothetical protein